jgi:hypothetical protein
MNLKRKGKMTKLKNKIIDLDGAGSLERIFNRDYNSTKFVIACYLDSSNEKLASYISEDLDDIELCYLVQELERRRRELY